MQFSKNFGHSESKIELEQKNLGQKNMRSENNLSPKKVFDPKKIGYDTNFNQHFLDLRKFCS